MLKKQNPIKGRLRDDAPFSQLWEEFYDKAANLTETTKRNGKKEEKKKAKEKEGDAHYALLQ